MYFLQCSLHNTKAALQLLYQFLLVIFLLLLIPVGGGEPLLCPPIEDELVLGYITFFASSQHSSFSSSLSPCLLLHFLNLALVVRTLSMSNGASILFLQKKVTSTRVWHLLSLANNLNLIMQQFSNPFQLHYRCSSPTI